MKTRSDNLSYNYFIQITALSFNLIFIHQILVYFFNMNFLKIFSHLEMKVKFNKIANNEIEGQRHVWDNADDGMCKMLHKAKGD